MLFYGSSTYITFSFFSKLFFFLSDPWFHPRLSPTSISSPEFFEAIYRSSVNASKNVRPVESEVTGPVFAVCNPTKRLSPRSIRDFSRGFVGSLLAVIFQRSRARQPGALVVSRNPIKEKPGAAIVSPNRRTRRRVITRPFAAGHNASWRIGEQWTSGEWIRTQSIPVMREPDQR